MCELLYVNNSFVAHIRITEIKFLLMGENCVIIMMQKITQPPINWSVGPRSDFFSWPVQKNRIETRKMPLFEKIVPRSIKIVYLSHVIATS